MFKLFHKRRISKFSERAKEYITANYKEPTEIFVEQPKKHENTEPHFMYSNRGSEETLLVSSQVSESKDKYGSGRESDTYSEPGHGNIRYSRVSDNYDSKSVDRALIQDFLGGVSTQSTLRAIENNTNMTFVDKMLYYIKIRYMRDADVYKAAHIDRRLFSKIVSDRNYNPSKDTCIALALAMELTLTEANDILSRAGYVLSHSNKRDIIIEYFFREHIYNLDDANDILYRLDQKILGR